MSRLSIPTRWKYGVHFGKYKAPQRTLVAPGATYFGALRTECHSVSLTHRASSPSPKLHILTTWV